MEEIPDYIQTILLRKFQGASAKGDDKIIGDWLSRHPEHREEISQLTATWHRANEWAEEMDFDTDTAWLNVNQRVRLSTEKGNGTAGTVLRINFFVKIAVAAAIAVGFIFFGWWQYNRQQEVFTTVTATADQHLTLPDGTTVWLRKGTIFSYPGVFHAKERKVYLSGEAFFDVKTVVQQPFQVETQKGMITVLGTSFVVNTANQQERVAVVTGKVLFADKAYPEKQCTLSAHEEALFTGKTFERKTFTSSPLQWQQDELSFTSAALKEVVKTLTIYYGNPVKIDTTQESGAGEIHITASFTKEPLSEVIDEIVKLTGLHYRNQQDTIILY